MLSKKALKTWIRSHGFRVADSPTSAALLVERPFELGRGRSALRGVDRVAVRTLAEAKQALAVNQQ